MQRPGRRGGSGRDESNLAKERRVFSVFIFFFSLEDAHNDSVMKDQQKYMCISMCGKKTKDEIYRNHAAIVVHPLTHLYR